MPLLFCICGERRPPARRRTLFYDAASRSFKKPRVPSRGFADGKIRVATDCRDSFHRFYSSSLNLFLKAFLLSNSFSLLSSVTAGRHRN